MIAETDAYLRFHGAEPHAVIIEVAVQRDGWQRDDAIRTVLPNDIVLKVDPRRGDIQMRVGGEDLHIAAVLLRQTVGIEPDGTSDVLETEIKRRLDPLRGISYLSAHIEAVGLDFRIHIGNGCLVAEHVRTGCDVAERNQVLTLMQLFIIWLECYMQERTQSLLQDVFAYAHLRMWGMQTHRR